MATEYLVASTLTAACSPPPAARDLPQAYVYCKDIPTPSFTYSLAQASAASVDSAAEMPPGRGGGHPAPAPTAAVAASASGGFVSALCWRGSSSAGSTSSTLLAANSLGGLWVLGMQ